MKIYGAGPSRSFRALWAAEEAGIDYEYIDLAFGSKDAGGNRHPDYLAINPQGKVPTLVDGELVIGESAAIVNYIANVSDKNLIPKDNPNIIAQYDEICYFILAELEQPLWNVGKHSFALPEEYRVPQIKEKTTAYEFAKAQKILLSMIENREYAAGDTFTMADVLLGHTISWAKSFKFDVDRKLIDYSKQLTKRDAYQRASAAISK